MRHTLPIFRLVAAPAVASSRPMTAGDLWPDENHRVLKPRNSLVWHREVFAWLDRYIGKGPTK